MVGKESGPWNKTRSVELLEALLKTLVDALVAGRLPYAHPVIRLGSTTIRVAWVSNPNDCGELNLAVVVTTKGTSMRDDLLTALKTRDGIVTIIHARPPFSFRNPRRRPTLTIFVNH